jgi:hypothetical protein
MAQLFEILDQLKLDDAEEDSTLEDAIPSSNSEQQPQVDEKKDK